MLDLRRLLRPGAERAEDRLELDLSDCDFDGFAIPGPVEMRYRAVPLGDAARLELAIDAQIEAPCARCLGPAVQELHIESEYVVREADLREEFPELPILPGGMLDMRELAYGELVIETPAGVLCREDCAGLCQQCGGPAGECACAPQPQGDPRLQVLRSLLDDGEEE